MRHVFLTGEIQVGKSTAIRRFLSDTDITVDGFLSNIISVDPKNPSRGRELHLARFDSQNGETDSQIVTRIGEFREGSFPSIEIDIDAFNTHGAELIRSAGARELIIMDELGRFEEGADEFKNAVFERLDGDIPCIGVVKAADTPFLDRVRAHPNVRMVTVTVENRDTIPALLREHFKR